MIGMGKRKSKRKNLEKEFGGGVGGEATDETTLSFRYA